MNFVYFTALRYLFGRSRLGAAGWISLISAIAIAVVTAALVCVLSVYNGYVALLLSAEAQCLPELMLKPRDAKVLRIDSVRSVLDSSGFLSAYSAVLQTQGLLQSEGGQNICEVYGVDRNYTQVVRIDTAMFEGGFLDYEADADMDSSVATVGFSLAMAGVELTADSVNTQLLFPRRQGLINPLAVASGFVNMPLYVTGVLPSYDEQINSRVYIGLASLQSALNYDEGVASAIALRPKEGLSTEQVRKQLQAKLPPSYEVLTREEQQPELTLLIKTEKVMVYVIMCFILVLATFNLASSLAMLIMEKELDVQTLRALGADARSISSVFTLTGVLISGIGSFCGFVLGLIICYIQHTFGFISSGEGFMRTVFPIAMSWKDIIYIILATFAVTSLSAVIPAGLINKNNREQKL